MVSLALVSIRCKVKSVRPQPYGLFPSASTVPMPLSGGAVRSAPRGVPRFRSRPRYVWRDAPSLAAGGCSPPGRLKPPSPSRGLACSGVPPSQLGRAVKPQGAFAFLCGVGLAVRPPCSLSVPIFLFSSTSGRIAPLPRPPPPWWG